ncbi:unnamed protein product [Leptosia nina]|uniref:Uncharacterized protein n=1 Tax=Leptosia nina TaxID=320188 RepID=A0AAV1J654_9NEOP
MWQNSLMDFAPGNFDCEFHPTPGIGAIRKFKSKPVFQIPVVLRCWICVPRIQLTVSTERLSFSLVC